MSPPEITRLYLRIIQMEADIKANRAMFKTAKFITRDELKALQTRIELNNRQLEKKIKDAHKAVPKEKSFISKFKFPKITWR